VSDEKTLDALRECASLGDVAKSQAAREILCAQYGSAISDDVMRNYQDRKEQYLLFGQPMPITGSDIVDHFDPSFTV
jgi:hypothetical protein